MDIVKIKKCSYLLPDPGGKVVRELVVEIKRLQAVFTGESTQSPLEMIRAKCEQYWNDPTELCDEEWHSILEFIHRLARSAENEIKNLRERNNE